MLTYEQRYSPLGGRYCTSPNTFPNTSEVRAGSRVTVPRLLTSAGRNREENRHGEASGQLGRWMAANSVYQFVPTPIQHPKPLFTCRGTNRKYHPVCFFFFEKWPVVSQSAVRISLVLAPPLANVGDAILCKDRRAADRPPRPSHEFEGLFILLRSPLPDRETRKPQRCRQLRITDLGGDRSTHPLEVWKSR